MKAWYDCASVIAFFPARIDESAKELAEVYSALMQQLVSAERLKRLEEI